MGTQNYAVCPIYACPGAFILASMCNSAAGSLCSGDTYLRLKDESGREVAANDDSFCGLCSVLQYTVPSNGGACQSYTLQEGCYRDRDCSGRISVQVTAAQAASLVSPTPFPVAALSSPSAAAGLLFILIYFLPYCFINILCAIQNASITCLFYTLIA
jgi:hypothetical protein